MFQTHFKPALAACLTLGICFSAQAQIQQEAFQQQRQMQQEINQRIQEQSDAFQRNTPTSPQVTAVPAAPATPFSPLPTVANPMASAPLNSQASPQMPVAPVPSPQGVELLEPLTPEQPFNQGWNQVYPQAQMPLENRQILPGNLDNPTGIANSEPAELSAETDANDFSDANDSEQMRQLN